MTPYWITFSDGSRGCVEAGTAADAIRIGQKATGVAFASCDILPYPANPRLNRHEYADGTSCPSFCSSPEKCKGRSTCPREYACDD